MTLEISIADREAILAAARASPTVEICGLLLGRAGRVERIVPCANVAADPARRFEIDPAALVAAHRAARVGGPGVIGHYHSHPDGRAEPSPRDAADARADGSVWIIVAADVMTAWRAVADGRLHGRFEPVACLKAPSPSQGARGDARPRGVKDEE